MPKVLGLDLGTNSIGWALVEQTESGYTLLDKGVDIFQEGVTRDKNDEKPAVQDRTEARALRRRYSRKRLRKVAVLRILVQYDLCPPLSKEQLDLWRTKKIYPLDEDFLSWQRTSEADDKNPYHDRYRALTEKFDLSLREDRYALGRAFYHLAQRRGFLSNRKDAGKGDEEGKVKMGIKNLSAEMAEAGCRYLGEYFYQLYREKKKIRTKYTARNEHYLEEFKAICEKQQLPEECCSALRKEIFFQRPLKSQKGLVGHCTFEKKKSRCPVSHPSFEEFRMLAFLNNVRITTPSDTRSRPLSESEIALVRPLFMRKSKPCFDFEDIAKKIAGKGAYACKGDENEAFCSFNFSRKTVVSGCPVTAALIAIFGDDWRSEIHSLYTLAEGKSSAQVLNDVWHVLFSFTDEDHIKDWAQEKLQLTDEQANAFASISVPQDYAALSLNAIHKILPFLRAGYRYDEAVFLANLKAVLPPSVWEDEKYRRIIESDVAGIVAEFSTNPLNRGKSKEQCVCDYLRDLGCVDESHLRRLYHPSMIDTYQAALPDGQGLFQLGSPRTPSVRNPMAMRALFRLRALVNTLLRERKIDRTTKINIEFARGLNDANRRKAIEIFQREREDENRKYVDAIRTLYRAECGCDVEPTKDDVLKYRLWLEQEKICPYTGQPIPISGFIGGATAFDIEHTVPRARGGDDSQMNKTLCESRFNRMVKQAKLPAELANHAEVKTRLDDTMGWKKKITTLREQIENSVRKSRSATTKEDKDKAIRQRHYLQMKFDYWKGKYERFMMTRVPDGFSNRQGVDIGIIGRYARLYLGTVFEHIYTVKGATTAEFRRMWGLQDEYAKKERVNHVHHCIDAITIACIGRNEYDRWARYVADEERYRYGQGARPVFEKPWSTFTEDVKAVADELLVSHHTPDNMPRQSRKKWRIRGRVKLDSTGQPLYQQGDTARALLHKDTFYGAIKQDGEVCYVVRKPLSKLENVGDVEKIVDDTVRQKVKEAIAAVGFKQAISSEYTVWMNEAKGIPIRKVRLKATSVTNPIHLKPQRDLSDKPYKQHYHVVNDSNYCMAIYEGVNAKGKTVRSFRLVSKLEAARYYKASTDKLLNPGLVPLSDADGNPLRCLLKPGTMVLFYENSPAELYDCSPAELAKRLYKVTGMSSLTLQKKYFYGTIVLKHHQEARPQGDLKAKNGEWKNGETYRPIITMCHTQFNAMVEGVDFELTVTGEVKFKRLPPC